MKAIPALSLLETRWAGRVADRLGAGVEIQFHPAIYGSPEELVNDAFLEYYLNDYTVNGRLNLTWAIEF